MKISALFKQIWIVIVSDILSKLDKSVHILNWNAVWIATISEAAVPDNNWHSEYHLNRVAKEGTLNT